MKITQITADEVGIVALTDTGDLWSFLHEGSKWTKLPPIPGSDESEARAAFEEIQAKKESRALDAEREIDLAALPPKLAAIVGNDRPSNMCPDCGMPWNGINCQECNI